MHVLELGSGCGLVGIAAGARFPSASVTLTDLPAAIKALTANIELNQDVLGPHAGRVRAVPLDWTTFPSENVPIGSFDLILASDVIWLIDLVDPFLDTLQQIVQANPACITLMSYQSRSKIVDERLFSGLDCRHFSCELAMVDRKVTVYRITRSSRQPGST